MTTSSATTDAATVARGYFEAVARRDIEAMVSFWEPGTMDVIHGVAEMRVPEEMRAWFDGLFAAAPDFHFEILDVLSTGEKAAVHWHATGTFNGTSMFEGLVPNGRSIDLQGCDVLTIRGGKIVGNDAYMNGAEMARQLGALPPDGSVQEKAMLGALNLKTRAVARLRGARR